MSNPMMSVRAAASAAPELGLVGVSVVFFSGSASFMLHPDEARKLAEAILSEVQKVEAVGRGVMR